MRERSSNPAIQLQSVSGRYRTGGLTDHQWSSQSASSRRLAWILADHRSEVAESDEDIQQKIARLEAILFLAREPLSSRKLGRYANLADGTEARTLVRRLNDRLDQFGRAFRVQEVAGGFQLTTRRKFAKWLRRLDYVPTEEKLSAPALETLAVVACRQPVLRADIEAIRGVGCGEILNQLMSRDLVRVGGRSEELGRPYLYNTTKRFLQVFGLRSLEELPRAENFRRAQIQPPAASFLADRFAVNARDSEVEEEPDVSVAVELEQQPTTIELADPNQLVLEPNPIRMEDEDYEEEVDDEEFDDDEEEDEDFDEEEFEDEDEDFEDEEEGDDEEEDEDFDDEDFDDDEEEFDDEEEDETVDDEEDAEEDAEEEVGEDEEWEEVEEEEGEEDEDDDWEDEDWEDDEDEWED
jgi:segregation and condensation protein B